MKNFTNEYIWGKIQNGNFIVAEIGKNFIQEEEEKSTEEYLTRAKTLISLAKEAGADAVKFQTHNLEDEQLPLDIVAPHFLGSDRYSWIKRNEKATPLEFWQEIRDYCDEENIIFFSTPMSRGAAIKLEKIGVALWKVGSADILDFVMLDFIASSNKPIIISSGMSTIEEVDMAIDFLKKRNSRVALLHCVSRYPCPPEALNLRTIEFLKERYDIPIGFSDHSINYKYAVAAVNMGATVIEKHFSLDRNFWGADHKVSLTPIEFKKLVESIKNKEIVKLEHYGDKVKILQKEEARFRPIFRKSLVAGRNIKKDSVIEKSMIYAMRPQKYIKGLPSEQYEDVVGKRVRKDFKKYEPINKDFLY